MKKLSSIALVVVLSMILYCCHEEKESQAVESNENVGVEYEEFSTSRTPEDDANLEVIIYFMIPKSNVTASLDSIRADLVSFYTDNSRREIQSGIEIFADSIESQFYDFRNKIGAEKSKLINYEIYYDSIYPEFEGGSLLVFYNSHYEYEGGAHEISENVYRVYDMTTGKRVTENDIFVMNDTTKRILSEMINAAIDMEYFNDLDDIWNNGDSNVNGNFSISEDSLYYQYQPYDYGPNSLGMPKVALPKDLLKPLLKKDGPLYEYWYPEKKKK